MTVTNLIPTANHSYSNGAVTYTGGAANYTNLSDSSDSTLVKLVANGGSGFAAWPLTDMPANFLAATGAQITIRCAMIGSKGNATPIDYVQILKADGSTAITGTISVANTIAPTTFVVTPSLTLTDKASWDGAIVKVKLKQNSDPADGSGVNVMELSVQVTHTETATPVAPGVTILRPTGNIVNAWTINDYTNIDDAMTQPSTAGGDSAYCRYSANGLVEQSWTVQLPNPVHTIHRAKFWIYARALQADHNVIIHEAKIRLQGTWYTFSPLALSLTTSFAWYAFGNMTGLSIPADGAAPAIALVPQGFGTGGQNTLEFEAVYMELGYDAPGTGVGSLSGSSQFSGAGIADYFGDGTLSGGSTFSGVGSVDYSGDGTLSGVSDFSGSGFAPIPPHGVGEFGDVGDFSGVGFAWQHGSGVFSGEGLITGEGFAPPPHGTGAFGDLAVISGIGFAPPPHGTGVVSGSGAFSGIGRPKLNFKASSTSVEILGIPEPFVDVFLTSRGMVVEVLGDVIHGGPLKLAARGCVVEVLGVVIDSRRREHEELFLLPWNSDR